MTTQRTHQNPSTQNSTQTTHQNQSTQKKQQASNAPKSQHSKKNTQANNTPKSKHSKETLSKQVCPLNSLILIGFNLASIIKSKSSFKGRSFFLESDKKLKGKRIILEFQNWVKCLTNIFFVNFIHEILY